LKRDQTFWQKQTELPEESLAESRRIRVNEEIEGKNVIFIAEENGTLVGLCWCTIVGRGVNKQGEVAGFYVESDGDEEIIQ